MDFLPDPAVVERYRVDSLLVGVLGEKESFDSLWVLCDGRDG